MFCRIVLSSVIFVFILSADALSMQYILKTRIKSRPGHSQKRYRTAKMTFVENNARDKFHQLTKRDPRRLFHKTMPRIVSLDELAPFAQYADDHSASGSTALLETEHIKDPHLRYQVIKELISLGANPLRRHALTNVNPMNSVEGVRRITLEYNSNMAQAQVDFYYRWKLHAEKALIEHLLLKDDFGAVVWEEKYYSAMQNEFLKNPSGDVKDLPWQKLASIFNNAVANATGILAPFLDPEFRDSRILAENAEVLASLNLIGRNEDGLPNIRDAKIMAPELYHGLAIAVGQFLSCLMFFEPKLFYDDPEQGYLYSAGNFLHEFMPNINGFQANKMAYDEIAATVREVITKRATRIKGSTRE